ncbi:MAG: tRNA-dihydrouridine synthase [bacterium]|nr:tRNA-dihydrouridine synthase [bacterium]
MDWCALAHFGCSGRARRRKIRGMSVLELLQRQPVLPAPMCGISDFAYRSICRRMGADLTYTQMVSAEAIARGDVKSFDILDQQAPEPLLAMQLFGAAFASMGPAVEALQARGATLIDFNMGCPARKVTGSKSGSALLRDLPLTTRLMRAMRAAARVPVTVKMRWDWSGDKGGDGAAIEAARIAEAEGFAAVCLHARTREQGYSGVANWELIARMKEAVAIPVIGNGDIRRPADALEMMRRSGCDAVMIGRAIIGDPWLLAESLAAVRAGRAPVERPPVPWAERAALMREHAGLMVAGHGPRALLQFRKHAAAYVRGLPGAKKWRERLMRVATLGQLDAVLAGENPQADI